LADVYDALRLKERIRRLFRPRKCYEIVVAGSGERFDPACVDAFIKVADKFEGLIRELK
jgi:HD-GYP domain-containing protein (c-di-GMP phosphodiesterase class II)